MKRNFNLEKRTRKIKTEDLEIAETIKKIKNPIRYEIVGICDGKVPRLYEIGSIHQICENELLNEYGFDKHKTIDDVIRDMDCFSEYKHYAKIVY